MAPSSGGLLLMCNKVNGMSGAGKRQLVRRQPKRDVMSFLTTRVLLKRKNHSGDPLTSRNPNQAEQWELHMHQGSN
ncbi:hypothetical protein AAG906_039059 [Vitis piasezkii]